MFFSLNRILNFNLYGFNSPRPAASGHSGESRNPGIQTGYRIMSGMTSDTPLLAAGQFIFFSMAFLTNKKPGPKGSGFHTVLSSRRFSF
jgi:hypothetical protein